MFEKSTETIDFETISLNHHFDSEFASDIYNGMTAPEKSIPSVYFYDERGSDLFEEICRLPEYYLTRSETEILKSSSSDIASLATPETVLVELGSGSSIKTRYLIEAFIKQYTNVRYMPIDVSDSMLQNTASSLNQAYPGLHIQPVISRYEDGLTKIEDYEHPKFILWLGSSIGNYNKPAAVEFLRNLRAQLSPNDQLLIGIDLQKDREILEGAYNDSAGVTAEFNLNLLRRINRELGANFDLDRFRHKAILNDDMGRIEMYLVSTCDQSVYIVDLDLEVSLREGEHIHTENSNKFTLDEIARLARAANFSIHRQWFDSQKRFSLNLMRPVGR